MPNDLTTRAAKIKLLLMDVDGVWTDGRLHYAPGPDGQMQETKAFDSQDGIGLRWVSWNGVKTGIISGRDSPATEMRARQLECSHIYQGHIEKIPILEEILAKEAIAADQVAYVGDDLTDAVIMRRVGLAIATANARDEVKRIAHYVTQRSGGNGAVREVVEILLKAQGTWPAILAKYEVS